VKKFSQELIDKAARAVLTAARKYGDKAAVADYSDQEQGRLLGAAYKYADLLRKFAPTKK
jgi:hypothetical protein